MIQPLNVDYSDVGPAYHRCTGPTPALVILGKKNWFRSGGPMFSYFIFDRDAPMHRNRSANPIYPPPGTDSQIAKDKEIIKSNT